MRWLCVSCVRLEASGRVSAPTAAAVALTHPSPPAHAAHLAAAGVIACKGLVLVHMHVLLERARVLEGLRCRCIAGQMSSGPVREGVRALVHMAVVRRRQGHTDGAPCRTRGIPPAARPPGDCHWPLPLPQRRSCPLPLRPLPLPPPPWPLLRQLQYCPACWPPHHPLWQPCPRLGV